MSKTHLVSWFIPSTGVSRARRLVSAKFLLEFCLAIFLIGLTAGSALSASVTGLVGYWPFYEGAGTTASDISGKENTGTLINGPTWSVGKFGRGLLFDGADQYVEIIHSDSLNLTKQLTVSAWIYNKAAGNNLLTDPEFHIIAAKGWAPDLGGSWTLGWDKKSNDLSFCVRKGSDRGYDCVFFSYDALTNDWHHITAVFNSGKINLYIDGLHVAGPIVLGATSINSNNEALRIGAVLQSASKFLQNWDGYIDEVQIYNQALTDAEIKALFQGTGYEKPADSPVTSSVTASPTSATTTSSSSRSVATPVITPNGGTFTSPVSVTLTSQTPGANIYYTTNGAAPTQSSTLYNGPFTLVATTLVKARAFKNNSIASSEASAWFTLDQQFDFSLSNSGNKAAQKGSSAQNTISAALKSGSSQSVSFAVSGVPSGASASLSNGSCGPSCSSTVTVTTSSSTPAGTFPIAVTGTGGRISRTTSFNLTVSDPVAFDFSLSNTGNKSVTAGSSVTNSITATLVSGSTQSVAFSVSGLPSGATASFSPGTCSPTCASTLTVTTSGATPSGTSTIAVSATGGGVTRTTSFSLTVNLPTAATPTITPNGGSFTGSVSVTMTTATAGASIYYTMDGTTPTQSSKLYSGAMTLTNSATLNAATFMSGYNSSGVASASFTINQAFDFSLGNSGIQSLTAGSSTTNSITATLVSGSTQAVTLSASGLPSGATASFSLASCSPTCSSTLTISTSTTTPAGTSTITVSATGGGVTRTTSFSLTVNLPTAATPTITPNGGSFTSSVSVTMATATAGASIYYTTDGTTPTQSSSLYTGVITLTSSAVVNAAAFMSGYNPSAVASASFTINQAFDFSLGNSGIQSLTAGSSTTNSITATLVSRGTQSVTFSASGLPSGATASFSLASCTPTCSSTLTISTSATTPAGTSTITVSASGGGVTRTTTINLTVNLPTAATPTISPNGGSYTGSVSVMIQTATSGASIYYTTDGSTPTQLSTPYSGAMTLASSATVKAAAFMTNYNPSGVASASFTVTPPFDFSLSNSGNKSVTAGSSVTNSITATLVSGSAQSVTFSALGLPAGATASFSLPSCTPTCSSTLTINTTAGTTPAGTSTITVSASGGGVTRTTSFSLTVNLPTAATPTISPNGGSFTSSVSVTMATTTVGASIYYTTDGTTPTQSSTPYSGAMTLASSATVKAAAFMTNYNPSGVASASFTVTQPFDFSLSNFGNGNASVTAGFSSANLINASLVSGSAQAVVFTATGLPAGATASFSLLSCTPTCSSTLAINTTAGTTPGGTSLITASASGGGVTRTTTFNLTVNLPTVATPTITPNGGSFSGSVSVTLSTATAGASIRYTTDGSNPTASSTLYSAPMTLATSATVKAAAFMTNYTPSGVASASFTVTQPFDFSLSNTGSKSVTAGSSVTNSITATLVSGSAQAVTFSALGLPAGATASFSLPSCTPTCSSTLTINTTAGTTPAGTSTITVSASGGGVTRTSTFSLTVNLPTAATPTITPNGGSFTSSVSVTMATATAGASIYYTTDGTTPTQSSSLYIGAMTLTSSAVVNAAAFMTNYNPSGVASATFTITSSSLTLSWLDMSTNETGFAIERKLGSAGSYSQVATVGANITSYQNTTLVSGSMYCFRVQSFNLTQVSAYSNEACVTAP